MTESDDPTQILHATQGSHVADSCQCMCPSCISGSTAGLTLYNTEQLESSTDSETYRLRRQPFKVQNLLPAKLILCTIETTRNLQQVLLFS